MYNQAITKRQPRLVGLLLFTCLAAWAALWLGQTGVDHTLLHGQVIFTLHAVPSFALGWALMTAAMMLPTSLPLILLFARLVQRKPHAPMLVAVLLAGYTGVWLAFGVLARIGYALLQISVLPFTWLRLDTWLATALILLIAGAYQFSRLKYACLDACRSPLSFITAYWRGSNEGVQALRLGLAHGVFCVGCCWSLMLLMFVVGANGLGWMLAIGLAMAVEKNVSWGRRITRPLGLALIGAALGFALNSVDVVSHVAATSLYWICTR